jgi:hypothetical protein
LGADGEAEDAFSGLAGAGAETFSPMLFQTDSSSNRNSTKICSFKCFKTASV